MREPADWLLPVLASKACKSLIGYIRHGHFLIWLKAWLSFVFHLPAAIRLRRPISSSTRRFLQRLDRAPVRNLSDLPEWKAILSG